MQCSSCGGSLPENAAFCPNCGTKVTAPAEAEAMSAEATPPAEALAAEDAEEKTSAEAPAVEAEAPAAEEVPAAEAPAAAAEAPAAEAPEPAQPAQPYAGAAPQPQPQPHPQGAPAGGYQPYAGATSQQQSQPHQTYQPYAGAAPQPQQPPQPQAPYGAPQQPVYAQGCVSAALQDLRASEGWFGKTLLLGLINCVPILNFVASGYLLNWAREVPFGGRSPLPKTIFSGKNFEIGFYYFLLALVFGLVGGAAGVVLNFMPLIGWLAALALTLLVSMFTELLAVRMAMMQQIGEGFKLSAAWDAIKRNWTGLLCAAVVPQLIAGLIVGLIASIAMVVLLFAVGLSVLPAASASAYGTAESMAFMASLVGASGVVGILLFLVVIFVCVAITTAAAAISNRAVAHWIGRYASDWTFEAYRTLGYQNYQQPPQQ